MTKSPTFLAFHWSGRQVEFKSRADAVTFVLARGDVSELWQIAEVL